MLAAPADLCVSSRWILPMTLHGEVLQNHTLVVRDGRILDLLPSALAAERYAPTVQVDRPDHLLLPGLVNAHTRIVAAGGRISGAGRSSDAALLGIAEMLKGGTTCFCDMSEFPAESARLGAAQGMRVLVGIPIAEKSSPWAVDAAEYLTRALEFRDEFRGHPSITTAFAPQAPTHISDATFARIATLANELDAGIVMSINESRADIDESLMLHGTRPIERLRRLGLLTPGLTAVNPLEVTPDEIDLAQRNGIAVALCLGSHLRRGRAAAPAATWLGSGLRLGIGTGVEVDESSLDLWTELKLLTLLAHTPASIGLSAWATLAAATRGGAAVLGLESEIGTLEPGKWADLCCVEFQSPAMVRAASISNASGAATDPVTAVGHSAGRDDVSDVWVAGRHLVHDGSLTRLDWFPLAARALRRPNSNPLGDTK